MGLNIFESTLVWTILAGIILWRHRERVATWFMRLPLPTWVLFLVSGFFFVIIEESMNCPPSGCSLIPHTWLIFLIFLLLHLAILKLFRIESFRVGVLVFGCIGWLAEFLLGASKDALWSAPWVSVVMTVWVIVTYAIIVIVPVTIFLRSRQRV